tara:strand:- start:1327 stop:1797 length:471 start_codon:yes stop_codon:yes gene_type:complete
VDDKGDPLDTSADGADGGVAEMETATDSGSGGDSDDDEPDMFAEEIELPSTVPLYTSAPNVLRMWLEAEGPPWGPVQNKLAYVWDVHLKAHGAPPVRLHVEDMVFDTFRDDDRPGITDNGQLVAINNDTWRMDDCTVAYYTSYDYRDECLRELVAP